MATGDTASDPFSRSAQNEARRDPSRQRDNTILARPRAARSHIVKQHGRTPRKDAQIVRPSTLVRAYDVKQAPGRPKTDSRNPDPGKRNRPLVGVQFITGMQPQGANKWSGRLYNVEDGNTYDASLSLEGANTLKLQGCVLFMCKTRTMTRKN